MLLARVQGVRDRFADIRVATKDLEDISPAALLVSAAEGIALALSLSHLCGVSDAEQISKQDLDKDACRFEYDLFWESLSGARVGLWYQFDVPSAHKALSRGSTAHRRRARKRRDYRDGVREDVRGTFSGAFIARTDPATAQPRRGVVPAERPSLGAPGDGLARPALG